MSTDDDIRRMVVADAFATIDEHKQPALPLPFEVSEPDEVNALAIAHEEWHLEQTGADPLRIPEPPIETVRALAERAHTAMVETAAAHRRARLSHEMLSAYLAEHDA